MNKPRYPKQADKNAVKKSSRIIRKATRTAVIMTVFAFGCLINLCKAQRHDQSIDVARVYKDAAAQTQVMLENLQKIKQDQSGLADQMQMQAFSPRTLKDGKLVLVGSKDWTSGFFPGLLWYLYEGTGQKNWLGPARRFTAQMEREKYNGTTHDMGFKIYSSFGNGLRLTHDPHYKAVILTAAKTLSTRYNAKVGAIRSWDHNKQKWDFPVIIDNMLNLELLFEATKLGGDSLYYHIADHHAKTTMAHHFRKDYSSFHVVDYDSLTGKVRQRTTHQGYSDSSAWARGQAWGLYGFTMCYRETKNKAFLDQADHIARFILNHPNLPKDLVPYWDFDAPHSTDEPRDASAAAVIASGLLELSTYSQSRQGEYYHKVATRILQNLTKYYRSKIGANTGFILLHSTGSKPGNTEVDEPLNYADYYYLEALGRWKKIEQHKPLF